MTTVWTDTVCATLTTRLVTGATSNAYSTLLCLPRVAVTANQTAGSYTVSAAIIGAAGGATTAYTACTGETCSADKCCVETLYTVNGTAATAGVSSFCGDTIYFLDMGLKSTVAATGTAGDQNNISIRWLCTKTLNPVAYAAKWESDATFFKFSMAVIFGLLALFAY